MANGYVSPPPSGIYTGTRAVNTQSYTASNVKLGLQFGITIELAIPTGTTKYLSFRTPAGANSIIIQTRLLSTNGGFRYTPRRNAVFTETGTPVSIGNLNGQSLNTSDVIALAIDNVPSNVGVAFDVIRSANGVGNQDEQGIFTGDSIERVLDKDEPYLLSFENLDGNAIYIVYSITWFEGVPDLVPIV
jgi:hypothetical protein